MENPEGAKQTSGGYVGAGAGIRTPVIHANGVTVTLDADALTMELRELRVPHASFMTLEKAQNVPPLTVEDFRASHPDAIVVLTFSAAVQLMASLNAMIPGILASRGAAGRLGELPR